MVGHIWREKGRDYSNDWNISTVIRKSGIYFNGLSLRDGVHEDLRNDDFNFTDRKNLLEYLKRLLITLVTKV